MAPRNRTTKSKAKRKTKYNSKRRNKKKSYSNTLVYKGSLRMRQPFPNRYFTYMEYFNMGLVPATSGTTNQYGFCINAIQDPLNIRGTVPNTLPTPLVSVANSAYAGTSNILYTAAVGSGLYHRYRVWSTTVEFSMIPQSLGDTITVAMAPVLSNEVYGTVVSLSQGPQGVCKTVSGYNNQKNNVFYKKYSIPLILGIPKKDFASPSTETYGTDSAPPANPVVLEVIYKTQDNATNATVIPWNLRMKSLVEFFDREGTGLYDT